MWGRVLTAAAKPLSVSITNVRPNHTPLPLSLQTNRLARLAPSSVVLSTPSTTILATVTQQLPSSSSPSSSSSSALLVDFRSKAAAVGIIPSTWSRREQQPALFETVTARLIDRSIRPVLSNIPNFPNTQISVSVLSAARQGDAPLDSLAVNAAAAALFITPSSQNIPLISAARVALTEDFTCIPFPSDEHLKRALLSVFVAVNDDGNVLSLSMAANQSAVSEQHVIHAVDSAIHTAKSLQPSIERFGTDVHKLKKEEGLSSFPRQMPGQWTVAENNCDDKQSTGENQKKLDLIYQEALNAYENAFVECRKHPGKSHRAHVMTRVQAELHKQFINPTTNTEIMANGSKSSAASPPSETLQTNNSNIVNTPTEHDSSSSLTPLSSPIPAQSIEETFSKASKVAFRRTLSRDGVRMDGRKFDDVRVIRCETGILPGDVHGSALFERGDTQVLACSTFGHLNQIRRTEDYVDGIGIDPTNSDAFFVHYSFPHFATGDYGRFAQFHNRREVGHSLLTERAISPLLSNQNSNSDDFPYALRLSTDVLGSDGSSSMASVCAGSMAIMDSGAPLREPVAGIAMGLIKTDDEKDIILTDILGAEDHFGDIDMKVAGTQQGITACQLDVKQATGLQMNALQRVLTEAKIGRLHILKEMAKSNGLTQPRTMSDRAPRSVRVSVNRERARNTLFRDRFKGLRAIGMHCGGSYLQAGETGNEIKIEAPNKQAAITAEKLIKQATREIRVGEEMTMFVSDVRKTFAKVEDELGCISGLVHISKMNIITSDNDQPTYPDVRRLLSVKEEVKVRVIECDDTSGIIRFQLIEKHDKQHTRLASEIDSILEAVGSQQSSSSK